ncbi:serine/threonine protein kinase [Flavonifractor sp. DFI.6.63]|uniref:serine/threonine protein kinase n=1 Tax=Flavonifractor sp. DFI.6.63 TaxID=2963704 RepID=UPI00210C172A|nr:serine/threonine protein kinase [Flavonifractor sp. DFI.6.63]
MIQTDFGALVVAFIVAMGVPSALMGFIVWKLERRIDAREKEQEKKNSAQQKLMVLLVQSTRASIALGEATAHAMQRGHTNGDMEAALKYAADVKHEQKDFLAEQGIHNLFDE